MAKNSRKQVSDTVMLDLGNHATARVQQVMVDTVTLLETQEEAYGLAASVMGGMVCWLAKLRPGEQKHATKIMLVMKDLAEIMAMHKDHGE